MAPFKWLILFIIDSKSLKRVNFNLNDLRSLKIKSVYTNHDDRCFKFQLIPALADECSTMKHQFINIFIFLSFSFFLISAKISGQNSISYREYSLNLTSMILPFHAFIPNFYLIFMNTNQWKSFWNLLCCPSPSFLIKRVKWVWRCYGEINEIFH